MLKRNCTVAFLLTLLVGGFVQLAYAQAEVDFTYDPENPVIGETIAFTAIVVEGDPEWFVRYEWDFDDDGEYDDGVGQTTEYDFSSAGVKPVGLRALDDRGGLHFVNKNVPVTNDPPDPCFAYGPLYPEVGELVTFDARCSSDTDGDIISYDWVFDDGSTATGAVVTHAFATAGQRPVQLTVEDDGGETSDITEWISVQAAPPICLFSIIPASPTVYDIVTFDASDSHDPDGGGLSYNWMFGDGGTASGRVAEYQFMNGGTYTIYLAVQDDEGQTSSCEQTLVVEGPAAAFTYSPHNPTTQDGVQFHDQSHDLAGDIVSWSWDFGDEGFSSDQHPLHTFAEPGTYLVRLTITSDGPGQQSATHSATRTVQVTNAPPNATFSFAPELPKVDQMVTFSTAGSGDPDGHIVMFEWDFDGDGVTDITGSPVTYAFPNVGAQSVRLTVTDDAGNQASATRVVPVQASPPTASFTFAPDAPYTGQTITFDASESADTDGTIVLYEWDLDADGTTDATGLSVTHAFPAAGVHPVSLMVTDNDGAVDVSTQGIPVDTGGTGGDNQVPEADFTVTPADGEEVNLNEVVTFKAEGSSDPDGSIISYEWDFDRDGEYDATGLEVTHVFHTGGAHVVTLRVADDDGAFGFKTRVVSVEFVRPRAEFTFEPTEPKVNEPVTFDGSPSADPDGQIDFYEWDFDDDGRIDATGQTVVYGFTRGGSLDVMLKVTDNDGVIDTITKTIRVAVNNLPVASFSYEVEEDGQPEVGKKITFSNESVDSDGTIESYSWEFGDGNSSKAESPNHSFDEPGTYAVSLQVTDNEGGEGEVTVDIVVTGAQNTAPVASFTYTPAAPGQDQDIQFTDESTDSESNITGWAWDFGDGTTSTSRHPVHAFTAEGTYAVELTVTDEGGLSDSATLNVVVADDAREIRLSAYPNPASREVTLRITVSAGASDLIVRVYDLIGRMVLEQELEDRATSSTWDLRSSGGAELANGLYFCIATARDSSGRVITSEIFRLLIAR